jgi:hypothetical protein
MNETSKPKYDRRAEAVRYQEAIKNLVEVCEENVKNAFDRDDLTDIIIAQKHLIGVLKLAGVNILV